MRDGLKADRPPCGRTAVVNTAKGFYFLALSNRLLCGDLGTRLGIDWRLENTDRKRGLMETGSRYNCNRGKMS